MDGRRDGAGRRGILGALATGAAAAPGVARALDQDAPHRAEVLPRGVAPRKESEAEKRAPRYRETEHVRAFYRTNRY